MFSSLSALSSSASTSSTSSVTTEIFSVVQSQTVEEKVPLTSKEEVEKKLASILTQVQQNQTKRLDLTSPLLGRFYALTNTLNGHGSRVYSLAVLANGQLASGSSDTTIKLWDLGSDFFILYHHFTGTYLLCLGFGCSSQWPARQWLF